MPRVTAVNSPISAGTDVWLRWWPVFTHGFTVVLAVAVVGAIVDPALSGRQRLTVAGLGLLFGLWHWRLIGIQTSNRCDLKLVVLYLAGACLLFTALTSYHPIFMFLVFFLYVQLFMLAPVRLAIVLSGPLTFLVWWRGAALDGGAFPPGPELLTIMGVAWVCSSVMAVFIERIITQSDQRRRLIEELAATRDELAVAERQAGIVDERQRLAREIHDTLAQGFASIVLHLEAAEAALPPGATTALHHLDQARRTSRESLAEARRLVWALRPPSLEHSSLEQALARLATRWTEESGVPARLVVTESALDLHPEIEVTLLRAAQEGLANVRKHADASSVTLTLTTMADLVTLDLQDDGIGFAPAATAPPEAGGGGYGLASLRQRVERLGGTLVIESAAGVGTTIAVALPTLTGSLIAEHAIVGVGQ
ncbi:MAG: sensor histidine kinase [Chloroflexota bacterium]|nr:sensor histidine kinase [Chloroflexota bacterium]